MATSDDVLEEIRILREQLTEAQTEITTRNSLDEALVDLKRSWRRWFVPVMAFVAVCLVTVGIVLASANRTVNRIEDCTVQTGACYKRLTQGGQTGVARLITYFDCILPHELQERTPGLLAACRTKALDTK